MRHFTKFLLITIFGWVFMPAPVFGSMKVIGTPRVINYDNSNYQAGTQTWMIDLAPTGLIYFANNDGMLEFDGARWRTYPLPKKSVVRSILACPNGKIYAAGHNELGYFAPTPSGNLVFNDITHLIPNEHRDFGEVWKIHRIGETIFFQSFTHILSYLNGAITVVTPPEMFHFSFVVHNRFFVLDQYKGLFELVDQSLVKLKGTQLIDGKLVWSILPYGNKLLISTADQGIFIYDGQSLSRWDNPAAEFLMANQVFFATALNEKTYAFGTIQHGVLVCDSDGNIIQRLGSEHGLQNNTVLSVFADQYNNLWLGLDNGIDYVEVNSPLTYFSTYNNLSSGYAAVVHNGILYIGTNRGVFYHDWESLKTGGTGQKFNLVQGTQGQVWTLEVIDGSLFCGHNSGVFLIEGTKAEMISSVQGGWAFIKPEGTKDIVLCGTYTNLLKFEKKDGRWLEGVPIKGFRESSRYLVNAGPGSVWISHGYKGVFRVFFNNTYDSIVKSSFYNSANGFPSDKDISVYQIMDRPVFTTGQGIYRYREEAGFFEIDAQLERLFGRSDMIMLNEDNLGNIWYFTDEKIGVFRLQEDGQFIEVEVPFRELEGKFVKWFQNVYPYDNSNVLIATQNGFAHYTSNFAKNYQQPFKAFVRNMHIMAGVDSTLFGGNPYPAGFYTEIPFKYNHIQFEFSANDFENPTRIRYYTKLEGFDKDWVYWQGQTTRQFTNLRHGEYTFNVRAVNLFGVESEIASLKFVVKPPWYLTIYAFVAYFIIALICMFLAIKYLKTRLEKSKKAFEEEQRQLYLEKEKQLQIESLLAEQEVIKLRNEKLQSEKVQRDKELANTTMQIIQKSKSLTGIKHDLRKLARELDTHPSSNKVNMIIKKINRSIDSEKQWEVFESHFENVHEEFLKRLKENYPDLTPRELKLCAYLRLNISSKEIANLMNISVRGVEISRYRLRKKLKLEHDTNLTDFILTY